MQPGSDARWQVFQAEMAEAHCRIAELTDMFRIALAWAEDEGQLREQDVRLFDEVAGVREHLDQLALNTKSEWERLTVDWLEEPFATLIARAEMCELAR